MKVTYNGITILRAQTTSWEESVEYDPSGMNMVANKIVLVFEGSVMLNVGELFNTCDNLGIEIQETPDLTFRQRLNMVLRNLSMSGGTLVVFDDVMNEEIFQAYSSQTEDLTDVQKRNIDIAAGPKPRNVRVLQIVNSYARISFQVEVTKIRCLSGETSDIQELGEDPTLGFVVSNRCWTEESLDKNFYTTRTYSGRLRISSPDKSVHFYRDLYYPPLEDGFRRESVRFSESEDGLSLSYSVTDKQVRSSAPYPATEFSGSVSYSVINGADIRLNMQLTMIGRPDCPKDALTARAMQAVTKRISDFTSDGASGFQEKFNVSENLGDPPSVSIDVAYRLFLTSKESIGSQEAVEELEQLFMGGMKQIGKPLEFDDFSDGEYIYSYARTKSPLPNPYGYEIWAVADDLPADAVENPDEDSGEKGGGRNSDALGFIKCLATVPCAMKAPIEQAMETVEGDELASLNVTKVVKDKDGIDYATNETGVDKEVIIYPYSFYKADITYTTDFARFSLPKASPAPPPTAAGTITGTLEAGSLNAVVSKDGVQTGTFSLTGEGAQFTGSITMANGKTGSVTLALASSAIEAGTVTGTLSDTEITGSIAPQSGDPVTFTGTVEWEEEEEEEEEQDDNTRLITLARPIPKALVVIEAERFNRLPELPNPADVVTTTGDKPIKFTCTKVETTMCDPQPSRNGSSGVSYSIVARYEYVMSREWKQGDEVWLLSNPTFGAAYYYPQKIAADGTSRKDPDGLKVLYDGKELDHGDYNPPTPEPEPEPEPENNSEE